MKKIIDNYVGVLKNYTKFDGRASRSEYWYFVLVNVIVSIVLGIVGGVLNTALGSTSGALKNLTGNAAKLGGIVGSTVSGVKSMWGSVQGVAKANGFQEIFNIKNNNI